MSGKNYGRHLMNENCGEEQNIDNPDSGSITEDGMVNREKLRQAIMKGLGVNYETLCYIDLDKDQIIFYRLSSRTTIASEECFHIYGFSRYAADYANTWVYGEDLVKFKRAISADSIRKILLENKVYCISYRGLVNGELQYLQLNLSNVGLLDEPVSQVVLGCRRIDEEIQEQLEQEQQLEDALGKANLAIDAKNTFLSNISHDMRTPLNAILGFTSLAKQELHDRNAVQEHLGQIEIAGRRLLDMITKVLEMSALSNAAGPAEVECNLREIIGEIYDFLLPQAKEKNISFSLDCDGIRHNGVYANQENLKQLVLNLVNNAVTYTKPGGRVTISINEEEELPNHYVVYRLVVEDTGIGISEKFLERIFDPFSREKNSTLSGIHSIGLGLTIAKKIADKMNGTIDVKSTVGEGSTFTVTLCFRVQPLSGEADKNGDDDEPHPLNQRILLVEDNEINREIEQELLEKMGFIIDSAENGKIALEKMEQASAGDYDLVIMDIQMPVMNGWQASAAIRALPDPVLAHIPIIALSANVLSSDRRKSRESGIDVHLSKPMDLSVLLDTIEDLTKNK